MMQKTAPASHNDDCVNNHGYAESTTYRRGEVITNDRVWWPEEALHAAFCDDELGPAPVRRKRRNGAARIGRMVDAIICPICHVRTRDKVADHDHKTGAVRDWICRKCNAGLGMFCDEPDALRRAADYLERHKADPREALVFQCGELITVSRRAIQRRASAALREISQ